MGHEQRTPERHRSAVGDDSELAWHSDHSYTRRPVRGTLLHAIELPAEGEETCFADLTRARETLPSDLEARIQGRRTRFSIHGGIWKRPEGFGRRRRPILAV